MTLSQDEKKRASAIAACAYINDDTVVGVGTGSTVNFFIEELAKQKGRITGAVASSIQTEKLLKSHNIPVLDLNGVEVDTYVDGADECTRLCQLIKGGGAALTREKIVTACAKRFVCIIDNSKLVTALGAFPLPVEVIPMARSHVARELVKLGGDPEYREGVTTDNGNIILDVHNLSILEPIKLEESINNITGVVTNGLFAARGADIVLIANDDGSIDTLTNSAYHG